MNFQYYKIGFNNYIEKIADDSLIHGMVGGAAGAAGGAAIGGMAGYFSSGMMKNKGFFEHIPELGGILKKFRGFKIGAGLGALAGGIGLGAMNMRAHSNPSENYSNHPMRMQAKLASMNFGKRALTMAALTIPTQVASDYALRKFVLGANPDLKRKIGYAASSLSTSLASDVIALKLYSAIRRKKMKLKDAIKHSIRMSSNPGVLGAMGLEIGGSIMGGAVPHMVFPFAKTLEYISKSRYMGNKGL